MRTLASAGVGIVIPTLNAGVTIAATLQSLGAAVRAGAEVLVIDGGSSDDTLEQVNRFGIPHTQHPGNMYDAINAGCSRLATPWLTWLNADDVLYGDWLVRRAAAAEPRADVVYGLVDFIDAEGRFLHCWRSAASRDLLRLYRCGYSPLLQQGTAFRRHVFERLEGFRSAYRLVADADFWWRALEAGATFQEIAGPPAAGFRIHARQLSQVYAPAMRAEHSRMVHDHAAKPTRRSGIGPALRLRRRNAINYVVRLCRHRALTGTWRLARSYDVSPTGSGPTTNH
jgi:glycosyltransferase involved in cell wall biosynthesis